MITPHDLYLSLSKEEIGGQAAYAALFEERLSQLELESIQAATNKAWALGSEEFKKRVERLSGRRTSSKPRGRPKKNVDLDE